MNHNHFEKAPFSIEGRTGEIQIKNSTLVLRPAMHESNFLDSDLYQHAKSGRHFPLENGDGHLFLVSFRDSVFENVYLRLSFENEHLGKLNFGWGPRAAVSQWTDQRVQADVERYRSFLMRELGPIEAFPYKLSWGTVHAARDDKSGTAAMTIRYRGFAFRVRRE